MCYLIQQNWVQICEHVFTLSEKQHPDKSLMGKIERGFDFLGYHFSAKGLSVADKTIERFCEHIARLYEQKPEEVQTSNRLGLYVQRWLRWIWGGIPMAWFVDWPPLRTYQKLRMFTT